MTTIAELELTAAEIDNAWDEDAEYPLYEGENGFVRAWKAAVAVLVGFQYKGRGGHGGKKAAYNWAKTVAAPLAEWVNGDGPTKDTLEKHAYLLWDSLGQYHKRDLEMEIIYMMLKPYAFPIPTLK